MRWRLKLLDRTKVHKVDGRWMYSKITSFVVFCFSFVPLEKFDLYTPFYFWNLSCIHLAPEEARASHGLTTAYFWILSCIGRITLFLLKFELYSFLPSGTWVVNTFSILELEPWTPLCFWYLSCKTFFFLKHELHTLFSFSNLSSCCNLFGLRFCWFRRRLVLLRACLCSFTVWYSWGVLI